MRSSICGLSWRYDSRGVVAYVSLLSPSGVEVTLTRAGLVRLPNVLVRRIGVLLRASNPPASPAERETFKGWLKAPFSWAEMKAFKQIHDELQAEVAA